MIICPNFSNPDVARDFNELKEATSEKAAYAIWSLNNGNAIDKAPNGALSKLFLDLLLHFNGDRTLAIRAKAKVYGGPFMQWFGDWIGANAVYDDEGNRVDEVSKVVDENGEPLVVYHGSNNYGFTVFNPLMADDKRSLFFSSSKFIASTYTNFEPLRNNLVRLRLLKNNAILLIKNGDYTALLKLIRETLDYSLPPIPDKNKTYDPRYSYYIDEEIGELKKELLKPGLSEEEVLELLADISKLEDMMWFSNNYSLKIRTIPVYRKNGQKEERIELKIDDLHKKDIESSHFIEKGIVFEGTPELLIEAILTETKIYDLFLNIKNPLILDNQEGEFGASNNWDRVIYKGEEYRTREISEIAKKEGYDGVIFRSIIDHGGHKGDSDLSPVSDLSIAYDYFHEGEDSYIGNNIYSSDVYIAYDPNQIKSATDNNGMFSKENNDILLHVNKRVTGTGNLSDEIQKEGYTTPQIVENVVQFLSDKFPGLKIHVVDDVSDITREDSIEQNIVRGLLLKENNSSLVYHGEVYIVRSKLSKLGGQIASEEILHMLVKTLQENNPQLFKSLLSEAKRSFKKLAKEVEDIYKKAGKDTIENELVTLALARYVNRDIQAGKHSRFAELVNRFVSWLKSILIKSSEQVGNFVYIDPSKLKSLTLQELSDLINAEDTKFDISLESEDILYHLNLSITRQMYDLGVQIDNERHQYVNSVLNQYKVNNPNASQDELSRVLNSARRLFNIDRSKRIMRENQTVLAQTFGLTMNRSGYFESSETTQKKLMYEFFINSLQESTFKAYNLDNLNRTKYQQVGVVENATSLANLLYNSIYDGDLVTLDKTLARDYVRMFWGSDLIQSTLKSLDNGSKTASQLEEELVSRMTKDPVNVRNTNIISWFLNIWQNLSQLVKDVFNGIVFTDQQKDEILRAVDAAFMLAEDLYYTNNNSVIYDRIDGKYDTSELLSDKDRQILSDIKQGTKTRLKSQLSRNIKNQKLIADLKSRLEVMEGKNQDSIDDIYNIIQDFLVTANSEINRTRNYIDRTLLIQANMENWNPQEINFIQQDLIGFYKNLLFTVYDLFNDETSAINKFNKIRVLNDPNAIDLKNFSKELLKTIENLLTDYFSYVVKPYVRMVLTNYVDEENSVTDKQTFVYNMERWLEQDSTYGDLSTGEVLIGMASRSKSPIVRIVEHMASSAEYASHRLVLRKGHELVRLYNKLRSSRSQISPYNWQKRFMEFDEKGLPTGYFAREINSGQFYLDKDAEEERLRLKYNLLRDENGNIIFNDPNPKANDSIYNKFNDEMDKWLNDHCHRRYTLDYYMDRRRFLSPNTLIELGRIQRQIDLMLDKCRMPSGYIDKSKLTISERRQLDILRKQKRDLGSHYIFTEDPVTGILHVENKTGEALLMADEITAWNKHIAEKVKYKPNWDAFNEAKQLLIDSGASQQEIDDFVRNNTTTRITSEFYDTLRIAVGKSATNKELEDLKHRHSEILNAIKERQGAGSPNLNKLGIGINTDRSGWIELQRIEQRMAEVKRKLKEDGVTGIAGDESLTFDQLATTLYITSGDQSNESYLNYLINLWRNAGASDTNLYNVFNLLFTFKDEKGRIKYLNAFKYLTPLDFKLEVNGKTITCIESLPGTEYSELDETSPYVNEFFKKDGQSMLPKAYDDKGNRLYKSKAYEELTSDEKQFLDALKGAMEEANGMIPNKAVTRDELLPQISGRTMSVLANTIMGKEWSTALKYPFRKFGVKYAETDEDVSTNVDLARRPDGTVVNNIPIRFINKLENRATLSTDVLGSVIMYYDMACNYANKSKNLPTMELIKFAVDPARNTNQNLMSDLYKKIENILDQRYYGKETSFGFNSNEKITSAKQQTIQTTKTIRNFASVAMLGINFTTIEVGYIDAMCSMLVDGIAGKYITLEDMRVALADCIKHTPKVLSGLGNPVVNDKLVAAMLYNNLSRSNSDIFASTDQFKLDRFVKEHLLMGGYTLTDYMVNGLMLRATYNTYRLIKDPKTNKESFYSKTDAINEFTKLGYSEKLAIELWSNSKITLWDAYDCLEGDFIVKDKYKDVITEKLENRVAGRLRDRTAMYNGVIPTTERAKIQQNVFGSFLTLMRNFYVNTYWDRFKTGGDYVTEDGDHNINWRSEYQRDDLGMVNFETGEFEGAVFKDFARGMYKITTNMKAVITSSLQNKLTREQKYAVLRSLSELLIIGSMLFLMLWSIAFARSNNYDDDKEPVWKLNLIGGGPLLEINPNHVKEKFMDFLRWKLALLSTRGFTERLTSWWAPTVVELFTSPSTATSYLDDIGVMWGFVIDLFSQRADEEIKTGGYKHMTRGTRDLLKLFSPLGIDNLVRSWHTDGIKSTLNFYRKLAPTSAIVPSQEQWNEAHGLGKHGSSGKKKKSSKKKFKEFE